MMRIIPAARLLGLFLGLVALLLAGTASAGDQPLRGAAPAWVVASPDVGVAVGNAGDAGLRFLLYDTQFHAEKDSQAVYLHYRAMALAPQALPLVGSVSLAWNTVSQDITIHNVDIVRDGETVDVLASQAFVTLRREENLEQAMLDGRLTAVLQPAGVRVGDIVDVSYTIVSHDPISAGYPEQIVNLNLPVTVDHGRYRASWPTSVPLRLKAMDDWTHLAIQHRGDQSSVEINLDATQPIVVPGDVPPRLRFPRRIDVSAYRDWGQVAMTLKPLYDHARQLQPASPLQAEIERIRALSDDPAERAAAALRLVQDQIRYVALLMGEGALNPASADETWRRRFGDCKAKTALLLALLDGLGIEAEPATVSVNNGDGMETRLPMISAFDHVLVRARVNDMIYWLDGTRVGDRALDGLAVPHFHWALPLTGADARLEPLRSLPRSIPDVETILALDASGGLHVPVGVTGTATFHGDVAAVLGGQLALISATQKDQGLRAIWTAQITGLTITEINSVYDTEANLLTMNMKGSVPLSWPAEGQIPPGSTYSPVTTTERPAGPFAEAPYLVNFPSYSRSVMTLRLPNDGQGFRISGGEVDRNELGHELRRTVRLSGDLMTVEVALRSVADEITAAQASAARAAEAARSWDPPRIFSTNYTLTEADKVAMAADLPKSSDEWVSRAYTLSEAKDYPGAVEAAGHAVDLDPTSSSAWANRGVYRFWTGDFDGAATDLDKAVDLDPSEPIAMNGHALLAMKDHHYDDAVIETSRGLRQSPGDIFLLNLRADAYVALEQYDKALRDYDTLIGAHPDDSKQKLLRIGVLEAAGRHDEADAEMTALAEAKPQDGPILLNQAALKLERGQAQEASDILDRALPLYADGPDNVLIMRAEASAALGRTDLVSRDLTMIRQAHPTDVDWLNTLCWTAAKAGVLLDQALKDCDAALALAPDSADIMDSRARVLLQQGDLANAVAAYDAALERSPNLAASLYGRGLARIALGQVQEGEADKNAAVASLPGVADLFKAWPPTPPAQASGTTPVP
ncbi:hypothetical protein BH10PSE2_BH10PSE2_01890 [soil metagenome]